MVRGLVFARAGGRCERCGAGFNLSYHHRLKRSQGGDWVPQNIVLVCGSGTTGCHGWIEHNPDRAGRDGWHVRPWEDPEDIPIKLHRSEWYVLTPDGEAVDSEPREEDYLAPEDGELLSDPESTVQADPLPPQDEAE
jgi:hypothetical protein